MSVDRMSGGVPSDRNKPDLHSSFQSRGDSLQHRERVALIIGIFEAADNRRRCAYLLRKLPLTQPRFFSQIVDELGNFDVDEFLFIGSDALGVVPYVLVVGAL